MSKSSISMTINGQSFYAEGDPAEVSAKLDEFMRAVFSPLKNAVAASLAPQLNWRKVLGCGQRATLLQVETRFRFLAKRHHPDKGGDRKKFEEIVRAREAARLELA